MKITLIIPFLLFSNLTHSTNEGMEDVNSIIADGEDSSKDKQKNQQTGWQNLENEEPSYDAISIECFNQNYIIANQSLDNPDHYIQYLSILELSNNKNVLLNGCLYFDYNIFYIILPKTRVKNIHSITMYLFFEDNKFFIMDTHHNVTWLESNPLTRSSI